MKKYLIEYVEWIRDNSLFVKGVLFIMLFAVLLMMLLTIIGFKYLDFA